MGVVLLAGGLAVVFRVRDPATAPVTIRWVLLATLLFNAAPLAGQPEGPRWWSPLPCLQAVPVTLAAL